MSLAACIKNFVTGERLFYWALYNLAISGALFVAIGWNVIVMGRGVSWSAPEVEVEAPSRNR